MKVTIKLDSQRDGEVLIEKMKTSFAGKGPEIALVIGEETIALYFGKDASEKITSNFGSFYKEIEFSLFSV